MQVIRNNTPGVLCSSSVVTIGNFDGVHVGHKALLERCAARAGSEHRKAVLTFEPLPEALFRPDHPPARLSCEDIKLELFASAGMELIWVMRFNQALAALTAAEFAQSVLAESLAAKCVIVGEDFRFGRQREGDVAMLIRLGREFGFEVDAVADIKFDGQRISSSLIRTLLDNGNLDAARQLLGRNPALRGTVIKGRQLGRQLGFPTANMRLQCAPCPLAGVFAVEVRIAASEEKLAGIASLGVRPVVKGSEFLVEVHIFDFDRDLYGQELHVEFLSKIRAEQDFPGIEELTTQMHHDEAQARAFFGLPARQETEY